MRLARLPLKIGLISAKNSRAVSDFLDQLKEYGFAGEVFFRPTLMQGEQTEGSVCSALEELKSLVLDLVVMTRGGGSADDLRWFDSYKIGRAIASFPVPVIAAIGHHDDSCVAEDVCYLRQKTPTAAADFILSLQQKVLRDLQDFHFQISSCLGRILQHRRRELENVSLSFSLQASRRLHQMTDHLTRLWWGHLGKVTEKLQLRKETLKTLASRLGFLSEQRLSAFQSHLKFLEASLQAQDPRKWLEQGWTQLRSEGRLIKKTSDLELDSLLTARLQDGHLSLRLVDKTSGR